MLQHILYISLQMFVLALWFILKFNKRTLNFLQSTRYIKVLFGMVENTGTRALKHL